MDKHKNVDIETQESLHTLKLIIRVRQGRSNDGNEKGYIDEQIGMVRSQLYSLIGEPQENDGKKRLVKK